MSKTNDACAGLFKLSTIEHNLKLWENSANQSPEFQDDILDEIQTDMIWLLYYVNQLKEGLQD